MSKVWVVRAVSRSSQGSERVPVSTLSKTILIRRAIQRDQKNDHDGDESG